MENIIVSQNTTVLAEDFMPLNGTDYVEYYVGNAKQAAYFYITAFGFKPLAFAGLETGIRDRCSYVIEQNKIRIILTSSLTPDTDIALHHIAHGDGIRVFALWVDDATYTYDQAMQRGAKSYKTPERITDKDGEVVLSGIHTYGETIHIFVERKNYTGVFMPGYKPWTPNYPYRPVGLQYVDHAVGNVGWNQMNKWVSFYENVMGFRNILSFDDKDISTEYSALMSKVMCNGNGRIKFPINEPAKGKRKSQVEEYLDFYKGEGCQHLALATDDILSTVSELQRRGVEFLSIPSSYYHEIESRVGKIDESIEELTQLGILVDRDDEGYLLQIFSKPVQDRPTFFFEIIQRKGAQSFGKGNFKALFEAIEREQELRGNL